MEFEANKRFQKLTLEQVQALDKVLTEVIPIYGRGNFPTLEVRAKDMIRMVRDRLAERGIRVKDVRLNGSTASHVMVRDNGMGYRDLDIIFGLEVPRQEDFQVIKEVVLGILRDLLPCGVNRRKITWLTMKEAYVQTMVKVFNEHDRWSLIALSNNRAKTVGLRFVSSLRRQFEFSVDSFQIILDGMLESYWETEKKQGTKMPENEPKFSNLDYDEAQKDEAPASQGLGEVEGNYLTLVKSKEDERQNEDVPLSVMDLPRPLLEPVSGEREVQQVSETDRVGCHRKQNAVEMDTIRDVQSKEAIMFEPSRERAEENNKQNPGESSVQPSPTTSLTDVTDPLTKYASRKLLNAEEFCKSDCLIQPTILHVEKSTDIIQIQCMENTEFKAGLSIHRTNNDPVPQDSNLEFSFPPPAKKTCSTSQDMVPDYCPSPVLQRKMSRKLITKSPPPEKWSVLTDVTDLTSQLFQPIEIPKKLQPKLDHVRDYGSIPPLPLAHGPEGSGKCVEKDDYAAISFQKGNSAAPSVEQTVRPKFSEKPRDSKARGQLCAANTVTQAKPAGQSVKPTYPASNTVALGPRAEEGGKPTIVVQAECMYGDCEQAMNHLRHRLIATHSPEEIRGGGLLKYSDLLVRNFRATSETEIKSLERYMCSRFFIDFPDVAEQQRKIEAYLQCHFIGSEETSKYDYLMTLRRVIDESTVCLMGHERRQTLNMITVLALRVLGEQNAIPNTAHVTCFYQPAPYMAEPVFSGYYFTQGQPPLVYHPYPLHVQLPPGLV